MNCNEVQNQLSEYLEKTLDPETLKGFRDHIAFCSRCRADAENLARTLQMLAALPEAHPPVGFTARVMARVREIEPRASFCQRLLLAVGTAIPLQAAAVVLIGILAVYIYQKEQPEKKELTYRKDSSAQQAEESTVSPAAPVPASPGTKARVASETPVHETKPQAERRQEKSSEMLRDSTETARTAPKESGPAGHAATQQPAISSAPAGSEEETGGGEKLKGADQLGAAVGGPQSIELANQRALRSAAPTAARSQIATLNYDLVLRLREQQAPSGHLGRLGEQQEADRAPGPQKPAGLIARYLPTLPGSDRPESVWLSIPQTDYAQFKKELATLGTIESERPIATRDKAISSTPDEPLRIRLTILPARDVGQHAPPVQPSPPAKVFSTDK